MDHNHQSWVLLDDVIGKGDNHHYGSRRSIQRQLRKAFDERGEEGSWKMPRDTARY
jgi:hypothetical protein